MEGNSRIKLGSVVFGKRAPAAEMVGTFGVRRQSEATTALWNSPATRSYDRAFGLFRRDMRRQAKDCRNDKLRLSD